METKNFKQKLCWLMMLVAFLATSQGALAANAGFWDSDAFSVTVNGTTLSGGSSGVTGKDLKNITELKITAWWCKCWKNNNGNICSGKLYYKIDEGSSSSIDPTSTDWGSNITFKYENKTTTITIPNDGAAHTLKIWFQATGGESSSSCSSTYFLSNNGGNYQFAFTSPSPTLYLGGGFNSWNVNSDPMTLSNGVYTKTVAISSTGDYEFKISASGWSSPTYGKNTSDFTRSSNSHLLGTGGNVKMTADQTGDYTFTFTLSSKNLVITYPPACTNPQNTDFTYTSSNVYTGSSLSADVKWNSGTGSGAITTYYTGVSPTTYAKNTTAPTAVGTYSITIDVAAGGNYCAKSGISLGNYSITCPTIAKPQISATKSNVCSGTGTTISTTTSTAFASYQLYNGSSKVGSSKTGTGSSLEFSTGNLTADATFTVVATPNVTGCSGDITSDEVSVSVTPNASIGSVSLDSYALLVDATTEAHATDVVLGGTGGAGTWTANNPTIASIAEDNGKYIVTALSAGVATFTYSVSGGCGSDSKTTSTLTVSEPCREPVMQAKPTRVTASQSETSLAFRVFATDKGTCEISSWGLKVYSNAGCTIEVATINGVGELTTSSSATPLQATGLNANTKYWAKSFANHSGGTSWNTSDPTGWATKVALGTTSSMVDDCQSATLSSSSELGGSAVTTLASANFRYSTTQSEVSGGTGGTVVSSGVTTVGSDFSKQITGLTPNTTYYYRAEIEYNNTGAGGNIFTYSDVKSFKTNPISITPDVNSITFATHVVLGQESSALKIANYTFCGHSFTTSDFALTGDNATDFTLTQQSVSSGTASVKIRFTPKSGIGVKSANLVVKEGGNVISTIPVSATADCITPTKANYSVSGNTYTYDGTAKTAVITPNTGTYGTFTAGTATYGGQASQTNVGEYTIHYTVPAGGNYCAANFDFDEKLTISKATFPNITGLPTETVILCSGLTEQLNPVCAGATFTYSSNDTGVATVNGSGLITAVAAGNATITVTATNPNYNDKSATVTVQVKTTPSVTITASPASVGPWEISDITVTPSAGTATVELWKGGSEVSPTDADVVFEGSGTAYKLKAANKTESSITYTVKATTTSEGCTSAEATKDIPVTKVATEVCQ